MYLDRLAARIAGGFLLAEGDADTTGGGAAGDAAGDAAAAAGETATPVTTAADTDILAAGATDAASATPAVWPENWRELAAGDDEKALKRLQRYAAPGDITKALLAAQDRIAQGARVPLLPDDATPEEIAAYRKNVGVPETADGYGFAFPDEIGASEADKAALSGFMEHMHERHVAPGPAKAAFDYYVKRMAASRAAFAEAAQAATIENMAELRREFSPPELTRNKRLTEDFLQQHFGQSHDTLRAIKEVLNLRLESGVRVEDYAPFMKGLFGMARAYADDEALIGGDGGGGGQSIADEKRALVMKSASQKLTPAEDKRLDDLIAAELRMQERRRAA